MKIKILDKYVAKNFLIGYAISFLVLIGLRMMIDLFVNIDEFTEHKNLTTVNILSNIIIFYGTQCSLYFRDFAGIITVVAAVFSLGKMTKNNELIAVMASGVSLKRVIAPIIILALLLTGILIIDQELIIPSIANQLTRSHDDLPGHQAYSISCLTDSKGSVINSSMYEEATETLHNPSIILKTQLEPGKWKTLGWITADKATFDHSTNSWVFSSQIINPETKEIKTFGGTLQRITIPGKDSEMDPIADVKAYKSDLTPELIPIRRKEQFTSLLSSAQLNELAKHGTKVRDQAKLYIQKNTRITDPIINLIMLLVALPILVCRDARNMKSAIIISFSTTMACFIASFVCKMLGTEMFFNQIRPLLFAWLPVLIFLPVAVVELDSMKT